MVIKFIVFCVILLASAVSLIVYKIISPDTFGAYLIWVLFILFIAIVLYEPWRIFI